MKFNGDKPRSTSLLDADSVVQCSLAVSTDQNPRYQDFVLWLFLKTFVFGGIASICSGW